MGTFSEYGETKLLGHITGQASYTAPTTYLALVTTVDRKSRFKPR